MKKCTTFLLGLLLVSGFVACTPKTETSTAESSANSVTDTTAKTDEVEASFSDIKHFAEYTEDFQKLVISLDGLFRGVDIGMSKDEVKKLELAKLVKETSDVLSYKAELGKNEYVDITYKFKGGKLNGIFAVATVSSLDDYGALNAELIDYYNSKLGGMEMVGDQETWKNSTGHTVTVKDVMKDKTYVIEIEVK
jgi:hypothetical protein